MQTFDQPRQLVESPQFEGDRQAALVELSKARIDPPIRHIMAGLVDIRCCFTLQSCYGHFVHAEQPHSENLEPLPPYDVGAVRCRIAYIAICIENSASGKRFLATLENIPAIDPDFIQFGSPTWFWEQHLNSYALQVEPPRFLHKDEANIDYCEALHVQRVRGLFFEGLRQLIEDFKP
jgi:hypothetical protein